MTGPLAHLLLEAVAYTVGFGLYRLVRRRRGDFLDDPNRWTLITAAVLGAAAGSKVLHHLAHPSLFAMSWNDPVHLMGGKTIVGGLVGGWAAVEATKMRLGVTRRTGDLYVVPLAVGMAVGRLGCFFAGLADDTYGMATTSRLGALFGIDFGDGVARHPTQLYEIVFLVALALFLLWPPAGALREGDLFRGFVLGYLLFRFLVDFLKPYETVAGLGVLQWVALLTILVQARELPRLGRVFLLRRDHEAHTK